MRADKPFKLSKSQHAILTIISHNASIAFFDNGTDEVSIYVTYPYKNIAVRTFDILLKHKLISKHENNMDNALFFYVITDKGREMVANYKPPKKRRVRY